MKNCIALYMIFPFYVFLAAFVTLALSLLTKRNLMNALFLVSFLVFNLILKVTFFSILKIIK